MCSDVIFENLKVAQKVKTFSSTIFLQPRPVRLIPNQSISSLHSSVYLTTIFVFTLLSTPFDSEAVTHLQVFQLKLYILFVSHFPQACSTPPPQ
jgi:hypothetical protein